MHNRDINGIYMPTSLFYCSGVRPGAINFVTKEQ